MGFLNPAFLLAGLAVGVPIFLHLFYRRESKTFSFPAIRYLLRTERERSRQIRTQQILLLLLRAGAVVLLVLLGARAHFPGPGASHEPTALALVIDNSLSATIVEDGRRRLDTLKAVARLSAAGAGPDDVIWVIRAGTPWEAATPGNGAQALLEIEETRSSHGRGDLVRAVARARALVAQSDLPAREVHLITDLQATAFDGSASAFAGEPSADVPVVVFGAPAEARANRGIGGVAFGGGLAPLAGRRTEATVTVAGGEPGDTVGVRLYVDGLLQGAARAPAGSAVRIPAGPFATGRVEGWAEIDADPLTADDRRYFSFSVRDPTRVAVLGEAPLFVSEAAAVLAENRRIVLESPARAATLVSAGGEGLEARSPDQAAFVFPVADAARLPALNRRLAEAGIPFRYASGSGGAARVMEAAVPVDVEGLAVARYYEVEATAGSAPGASSAPGADSPAGAGSPARAGSLPGAPSVVASLSNGDPWLLTGNGPAGAYVLLASPLDEASSDLPVSAAMVPLLEWAVERWAGSAGSLAAVAGEPVRPPPTASAVRDPDGAEHPVDGDQPYPATAVAGLYRALDGDSVIETFAVNAPPAETDLTPIGRAGLGQAVPGVVAVVGDADAWSGAIFRAGRGPEPWRLLAVLLLVLLVVESSVAASTRIFARARGGGGVARASGGVVRGGEGVSGTPANA